MPVIAEMKTPKAFPKALFSSQGSLAICYVAFGTVVYAYLIPLALFCRNVTLTAIVIVDNTLRVLRLPVPEVPWKRLHTEFRFLALS